MRLPLPISSYRLPSPSASSSRLVNCFAEPAQKGSPKGVSILRRSPGIRSWVEVGDGPIRGMVVMGGILYALSGQELYAIDSQGDETQVTGSVSGAERVRMSTNGSDIVIVRPFDNSGYSSDGSTVGQINDGTFTAWGAADVDFLDGFLVFRRPDSQQFFNSGLNAVTFDGLDIASAEGAPDNLNGLIVDHRELFLTGESSSEIWYNAGLSPGSPFARSPNGLLEIGSAASYSLAKQNNSVFWLANDKTFRRLNGITPEKVSNFGIDAVVQGLERIDDCFALPYRQEGHEMVAFTFPYAGRTVVYDATIGEWHDRESLGYDRWRANAIINHYGHQLVGDSESGRIGILDPDTHEEWGEPQRVELTYQPVYAERHLASHKRFELVVNPGEGVTVGQGSDPLATLKVSDDGGQTFRAFPTRSLGKRGHYRQRAVWHKLGSSRDRVYRVEITDPVPLFITDTQVEVEGGAL